MPQGRQEAEPHSESADGPLCPQGLCAYFSKVQKPPSSGAKGGKEPMGLGHVSTLQRLAEL